MTLLKKKTYCLQTFRNLCVWLLFSRFAHLRTGRNVLRRGWWRRSQSEEGLKVCTEEFRRGLGWWGVLAGVGCKKTLIDLANGSFSPQNSLHPALSLISWKSHLLRNDFKKQFHFKNQAMITFRVQMQLVSKSLSDADYLSTHLIHHCMCLVPGILNKELFLIFTSQIFWLCCT